MKTLVIGLDGATFTILESLMNDGVMPCLRELTNRGCRAELRSTILPLTPTAWTSLTTGRCPGEHGIFDFVKHTVTPQGFYVRLVDSRDIRSETIYSMLSRQGKKAISLNFPVMFPPQPLNGCLIAGLVSWRLMRRAVYPVELYDSLKKNVPGFNPKELCWDMDTEEKAVQEVMPEDHEEWINFHIRREQQWFNICHYLMRHEPADLSTIIFDGVDKLQHLCWPFLDPALSPGSPHTSYDKIRNLCLQYFRQLDKSISELMRLAGDESRVFFVSDHGFGPTWDIFHLNVWLQQHGYLEWADSSVKEKGASMFSRRDRSQVFNWKKTLAYAVTPSSNGIHIRISSGPGEPGVQPDEYETFINKLTAELLDFTDAEGKRIIQRAMRREEAFPGRYTNLAPDLTLILHDHGFVSVAKADEPLKKRQECKGMHRPEGIMIAVGAGIRQGVAINQLSILDICPALLYSLGLDIPHELNGRFPAEIFEPSLLANTPPHLSGMSQLNAEDDCQRTLSTLSPKEEEAIFQSLRALGYME